MFSAVPGSYRSFIRLDAAGCDDRVEAAPATLWWLAADATTG
jgi:hypothetical protein